jgi:hypothetical protein
MTQDVTVSLVGTSSNEEATSSLVDGPGDILIRAGASIGSALTLHGNLHNLLIVLCLAYDGDDIQWLEFLANLALPIPGVLLCCLPPIFLSDWSGCFSFSEAAHHEDYATVSTKLDLTLEEENGIELQGNANSIETGGDHIATEYSKPACTTTTEDDNTEDETDDAESVEIRTDSCFTSARFVALCLVFMIIGYAAGGNVLPVTGVVVMILLWVGRHATSPAVTVDPVFCQLDYEPLFTYIGVALLTLAWTATGVPQNLFLFLPEECQWLSPNCKFEFGLIQYVMGVLISPTAAAFVFEGTLPFAAPYDWLQVSFALSMAYVTRSIIPPLMRKWPTPSRLRSLFLAMVLLIMFLGIGTFLLATFHSTYECSKRLGECG